MECPGNNGQHDRIYKLNIFIELLYSIMKILKTFYEDKHSGAFNNILNIIPISCNEEHNTNYDSGI